MLLVWRVWADQLSLRRILIESSVRNVFPGTDTAAQVASNASTCAVPTEGMAVSVTNTCVRTVAASSIRPFLS